MGWLDFLTGSTPGAIAGEASSKAVGSLFTGITDIVKEFHLSPEDELKYKLLVEQTRLDFYKAQTTDVQSARQMQMGAHSVWPGIISLTFLIGFFAGGGYIVVNGLPVTSSEGRDIIMLFAQTLMLGVSSILGFWLGSSYGGQRKDTMLFNSAPVEKK